MNQPTWRIALLSFGLALAAYCLTLTAIHTFDAYSYAAAVQTKPWQETFHPHHLAYGPLGALAYKLAQTFGYTGAALLPLQVVNALAGALGVALWTSLLHRLTGRISIAVLGAVLLGASYAFWYYAVEVEVYTLAALFLIGGVGILARLLDQPDWQRGWWWLGLAHSGAMLFHQTNVLWGAVALIGWLVAAWPAGTTWAMRLRAVGRYALVAALVVGGAYLAVMLGWSGFRTWAQMRGWLFEYAATGFWGGPVSSRTLSRLGVGWSHTLVPVAGGWLWLLLVAIIALGWRALTTRWRALMLVCGTWLLVYGLFFGWWEADNIEFWIATLPPITLLVCLALHELTGMRRTGAWIGAALVGVVLLWQNGLALPKRGDASRDSDRQAVIALAQAGEANDLYLVPNGMQELYLRYEYGRTNVLALSLGNGDWSSACTTLRAAINDTTSAGYRVWIDAGVLNPPEELLRRYQLERDAVQTCFAPFGAMNTQQVGNTSYSILSPTAGATPDWRWRDWTLGWRPNFIRDSSFGAGWRFIPDNDPHLLSPRLELQASEWSAAEITLSTTLTEQHAQLYWIAPGAGASEERSITWNLNPDGQPHTYRLDLAQQPGWQGEIALLRLDPVIAGDGTAQVTLIQLRLLK